MNNDIKDLLDAEIQRELDNLDNVQVGTEEYKSTVEGVSKLIDRLNEMNKHDLEIEKHHLSERIESNRISRERKLNEHNEKNQLVQNLITVGSILIPVFVTVWGTYKTLKFEETGTVTTIMGRGFINKLLPKK